MAYEDNGERMPFAGGKVVSEMTLVEIAEQLEKVTSWIEAQRVKEREARVVYQAIAQEVEGKVQQIKQYANQLVDAQNRKVSSFSGMLSRDQSPGERARGQQSKPQERRAAGPKGKLNIGDGILAIWSLSGYQRALTTEEIGEALPATGYKSNAAPTSLKSSINQSLAKLCRSGVIIRYRSDGVRISPRDTKSRARKYLAAAQATDE